MQFCPTVAVLEFPQNAETSGGAQCVVDRLAGTYTVVVTAPEAPVKVIVQVAYSTGS